MKPVIRAIWLTLAALPLCAVLSVGPAAAACNESPRAGVDWSKCEKRRLILRGQDLSKGTFLRTDFSRSDLADAKLIGADLTEANFEHARLAGADLSGAVLIKSSGDRADFAKAVLRGADLTKAAMARTDFTGADFTGAFLQKSELSRAVMVDAVLDGADLARAEIARTVFRGASLAGSNLTDAYTYLTHFEATDLSQTQGLVQQQLDAACGDAQTKLPPGLLVPASWPCGQE
jgi:uncharacterized protein YjbI with pentapeptide repeats